MAEALGIATSIISLVSLCLTVSQVSYDYVSKVRDSSASVSRYLHEILALSSALLKLQETLALPGVTEAVGDGGRGELLPKGLIAEAHRELEGIKRKLERRLQVAKGTGGGGVGRRVMGKLVWPFEEKETMEIVEKLARWNGICGSVVASYNLRVSSTVLQETRAQRDESKRADLLQWLWSNPEAVANEQLNRQRCEGTCLWMLDTPEFRHWQERERRFLLCSGPPGVGKTILTSFLVDHLIATEPTGSRAVYHYYDYRSDPEDHTGSAVARHLLRQLLAGDADIPQSVQRLYDKAGGSDTEISYHTWKTVLQEVIESTPDVFVLFDGIDECEDLRGFKDLFRILKQTPTTRVYLAGRSVRDLNLEYVDCSYVELESSASDLSRYIRTRLADSEQLDGLLNDNLIAEAVTTIADQANGVFLLAKIALDNLDNVLTIRQFRSALKTIPGSLRFAHQATFDRIMDGSAPKRELALSSLAWLIHARRPLRSTELLHAIAMEPEDLQVDGENLTTANTIVSACLGFVEHRADSDLVSFTHATVMEFLDANDCMHLLGEYRLDIARTCVKYLSQPALQKSVAQNEQELLTQLDGYPLLDYAASHWGLHAADQQSDLATDISKLLESGNSLANAAQIFHYRRRAGANKSCGSFQPIFPQLPQNFTKLHLLSLWGLSHIALLLAPTAEEVNTTDSLEWTPLHWAAARGHADMVNFLITRGALIEAVDFRGWTPLFWTAFWGRPEAAVALLNKGANLNATDKSGETPLQIAITRGHASICDTLLRRGADWSQYSFAHGKTLLEAGLMSTVPEIVVMFLAVRNGDSKASDQEAVAPADQETALERAASAIFRSRHAGRIEAFAVLLQAETTAAERKDWTRPLLSRLESHLGSLRHLDPDKMTSIGQDVDMSWFCKDLINQESYAAGALGYAILTGNMDLVQALVDVGVSLKEDWGAKYRRIQDMQYPVLLAAFTGNVEMIKLLVNNGASVNVADFEGQSPLIYAVVLGHLEAVRELCSHSELVIKADHDGGTPLHAVWSRFARSNAPRIRSSALTSQDTASCTAIVELLVEHGAQADMPDYFGQTPLHQAVKTGRAEAVEVMLRLGADPNARDLPKPDLQGHRVAFRPIEPSDKPGDTPFMLACKLGHFQQARILHTAGGSVPTNESLIEPIERAIAELDLQRLQALFSFGTLGQILDGSDPSQTPLLHLAVRSHCRAMYGNKYEDAMEFLPRCVAASSEAAQTSEIPSQCGAVIEFLLKSGLDADALDDGGGTALMETLKHAHSPQLTEILLNHGANLHICNDDGRSALHVAAVSGIATIVKRFLAEGVGPSKITLKGRHHPLALAAANGHEEVVEMLLSEPSLDDSLKQQHDWELLAKCHAVVEARDLLRFRELQPLPNIPFDLTDRLGRTLLHLAADSGHAEMVKTFLAHGADRTAQDSRGNTPLHVAALSKYSSVEVVKALVEHTGRESGVVRSSAPTDEPKEAIHVRNRAGSEYGINCVPHDATPLHLAAYAGNLEIVEALLGLAGIPLKARKTPPRRASGASGDGLARFHGGARADTDTQRYIDWASDECGRTALMAAVQQDHVNVVRCLLEACAEVNLSGGRGSWGFNALDLARAGRRVGDEGRGGSEDTEVSEMVKLLEEWGAEEFDW